MGNVSYKSTGALRAFMEAVNKGKDGQGRYICPCCGSGSKKNGTSAVTLIPGTAQWKCHACGEWGDIFAWAGAVNGLDPKKDFPESKRIVFSFFGGNPQGDYAERGKRNGSAAATTEPNKKSAKANWTQIAFDANERQTALCRQYIKGRGLNATFCDRYGVRPAVYHAGKYAFPKIFFPNHLDTPDAHCGKYRDVQPNSRYRYGCLGHQGFFNVAALDQGDRVFIVEGELDALSIEYAGYHALALGSVNSAARFVDYVSCDAYPPLPPFIIALDPDAPGQRAADELEAAFKKLGLAYTRLAPEYFAPCKDANEFLMKRGRDALANILGVVA